jgi:carbamoyl-phosphate synthase large subunit
LHPLDHHGGRDPEGNGDHDPPTAEGWQERAERDEQRDVADRFGLVAEELIVLRGCRDFPLPRLRAHGDVRRVALERAVRRSCGEPQLFRGCWTPRRPDEEDCIANENAGKHATAPVVGLSRPHPGRRRGLGPQPDICLVRRHTVIVSNSSATTTAEPKRMPTDVRIPRRNVLVTSAGRRGALTQIFLEVARQRAERCRVVAADMTPLSAAGQIADEFVLVPACSDPAYVPRLLEICDAHEIALVVPTIDTELAILAQAKGLLAEHGTTALCSGAETVRIASDKRITADWLASEGFPTPRTTTAAEYHRDPSAWEPPVFVKPARGSSSIGARVVDDPWEIALLEDPESWLVQSIAGGAEFTCDAWVEDGRCRCVVPRQRLATRAGEVSKAVTRRLPQLEQIVASALETLPDAFGPLTVQAFVDGEKIEIVEVNARFGGGYPLAWEAGARYPEWAVNLAIGRPSGARNEWRSDVVMLRYDAAVYCDASDVDL